MQHNLVDVQGNNTHSLSTSLPFTNMLANNIYFFFSSLLIYRETTHISYFRAYQYTRKSIVGHTGRWQFASKSIYQQASRPGHAFKTTSGQFKKSGWTFCSNINEYKKYLSRKLKNDHKQSI